MPDSEQTKALFRCLLAYSDGHPVEVLDMTDNHLHEGECLTAIASTGAVVKVAVVGRAFDTDFDATECPELLAAAYEMFVSGRELLGDHIRWVPLKTT